MKRQLAVVTVDSDIVGVLRKMPHIFTYADIPLHKVLEKETSSVYDCTVEDVE